MSTTSSDSSPPRRLTFFTPPQSPQSPQSPQTSQPSTQRTFKVITSSPRKRVSFPVFPEETKLPQRQTSRQQNLANEPTLWSDFSNLFRQRISIVRLIKVIILIHAAVLIIRIIDIRIAIGKSPYRERDEEYSHGEKQDFQDEEEQSTPKYDNRDASPLSHQFEPYELVSPLYDLANLDISPQLDVLKDAYSDSQYGLNRLRDGLPELSKDSPGLNIFRRETDYLREELAKVKPGDEAADLNLEECRTVGVLWINHYKRLKLKIRNIWRMKHIFTNIIDSTVEERRNLEKAFKEAESGMTKEAKKQGWDSFDFPSAYQFLERFSLSRTKGKNWGGYEETIKELITYIDVSLKDANAQIEHLMADFQRGSNVNENKADVDSIDFPTIFDQMEALNLTFEKYEQVKVLIESVKGKSLEGLKGRAHDSKERYRYYNYVAGQQTTRFDKHIIASRDGKKEEFLQNLEKRKAKQSQKGG
ncbi:uncharacterized protein EAF01_003861 [Botrytis porri]|uniref:uncharacterized protein n=1 Tax=Botrytis porri TaxID=87229 RepID=UPI001901E0AE|nr:uncharacterized protein EAF01_003861 [Botrytis porri]KAF7908106.1 hypothetical protein EAF01_003861 [Botrytis porri]